MINRLLPAPWLSLALWLLWLLMNLSLSPGHLLLGALLGWLAPLLMASLRPLPVRLSRPGVMLRLMARVTLDMLVSNLQVLGRVVHPTRAPASTFVKVPLELRDANGLATLAVISALVPGTVWSELALDRSALLIHVLHLGNDEEQAFIAHFKATYEHPLMEIFE